MSKIDERSRLEEKKRLLKELADLKKLQARKRKEADKAREAIKDYENKNKLLYFGDPEKQYLGRNGKWKPNPPQHDMILNFPNPNKEIFIYEGGNRSGKTTLLVIFVLSAIAGRFPWEPPEKGRWLHEIFKWEYPIRVRIVGQDWEKHIKGVLIPTMKELFPLSWKFETRKNQIGAEAYWYSPLFGGTNDSPNIEIVSSSKSVDPMTLEGWKGHFLCFDEPPRREIRTACARGLTDYNGKEYYSMTLLEQPWISTEIVEKTDENGFADPSVCHVHAETWDNEGYGLSKEGIDNFIKKLTPEEVESRIKGIPAYKQGCVLQINRQKHVIDRFPVPSHWPIDVSIDIGVSKPHDILYEAIAPNGFKYFVFEETLRGNGTMIADSIIKKKNRWCLRINRVICDPLAKADQNNENSTWEKIDTHLQRYGLYLEAGSKDKDDGIIILNDLLWTVNKMPALFIFRDLIKTIRQLSGWMYDKDTAKPSKNDDDMCENAYRLALLETEYSEPEEEDYDYSNQDSIQSY